MGSLSLNIGIRGVPFFEMILIQLSGLKDASNPTSFCSKNEIELVESGDETIPSIVVLG